MTTSELIETRRQAAVTLDHAIARIGYWGTNDKDILDAAHIIQHAKWSLEAMDSPATNRFWDEQRRMYRELVESL